MGQPPVRRADPGDGRRDAAPGRDRCRRAPRPERRRSRCGSTRSRAMLGIAIDRRDGRADPAGARARSDAARRRRCSTFRPPSWRSDLEREIDLIEEVARIHGYEHIPEDRAVPFTSAPRATASGSKDRCAKCADRLRVRRGGDVQSRGRRAGRARSVRARLRRRSASTIRAGSARNALRQSLVPSLLAVAAAQRGARQCRRRAVRDRQRLSASARPASARPADPAGPGQRARLPGAQGCGRGSARPAARRGSDSKSDPAQVPLLHARPMRPSWCWRGRTSASLAKCPAQPAEVLELRGPCAAAELELGVLRLVPCWFRRYRPCLRSRRGLARPLARGHAVACLVRTGAGSNGRGGPALESIEFLDTFQGGNVPKGNRVFTSACGSAIPSGP